MQGKSIKFVHLLNLLNCDSVNKVTKALKIACNKTKHIPKTKHSTKTLVVPPYVMSCTQELHLGSSGHYWKFILQLVQKRCIYVIVAVNS